MISAGAVRRAPGAPRQAVRRGAGSLTLSSALGASALGLVSCRQVSPPPIAHPHYVVGAAYQADGLWRYPREEFSYRETGLAVVDAGTRPAGTTADGEVYDPQAMAGSHPTLQLPVDVTVRNLENGREIDVRLDDRGPARRGRLISLTPRAAAALGMGAGLARVEVEEIEASSRGYAETLPGGPMLALQAAPVTTVTRQDLPPPGRSLSGVAPADPRAGASEAAVAGVIALPRFPVSYRQGFPRPGGLWVETGRFTQRRYASMEAIRAGGTVWPSSAGSGPAWTVRVGPFNGVDEADAALDRALAIGLTGAHIVVE